MTIFELETKLQHLITLGYGCETICDESGNPIVDISITQNNQIDLILIALLTG